MLTYNTISVYLFFKSKGRNGYPSLPEVSSDSREGQICKPRLPGALFCPSGWKMGRTHTFQLRRVLGTTHLIGQLSHTWLSNDTRACGYQEVQDARKRLFPTLSNLKLQFPVVAFTETGFCYRGHTSCFCCQRNGVLGTVHSQLV